MKRTESIRAAIFKHATARLRLLTLWLLAAVLLASTGLAHAATYSLPSAIGSGPFSSCSGSAGYYTCTGSIFIGSNDTLSFSSNMTLRIADDFVMRNNGNINGTPHAITISTGGSIDIGNSLASSVNFNADVNFVAGNSATIAGNITAGGDISIGTNANITGDVTAGGDLHVGSGTITGNCTYQTTNYVCSGGSTAASFSVVPSTTTASTCATAGGSPAAPWITITAKSGTGGSGSTVISYTGNVTISGIGSGTLSVRTGNGTLSGNTYSFVSADNGVAELYLTDPTAENVTPSASDNTISGTASSAITFSDNVLVISDADTLATTYQPIAGRTHALKAAVWRKNPSNGNCSINTTINNSSVAASMWITSTQMHPFGAESPQVSNSSNCAASVTLPSSVPGSTNINLNFSNGQTTFYLCTSDVGQYSVNITAASLPGSARNATASNTLTVIPFAVVVSDIRQGTIANPGTITANGSPFFKAGSEFQATVSAFRWNGNADAEDNDGFPDNGVSFANATSAGLAPRFAHTVTLAAAAAPIYPTGGTTGSGLANGVISVTGGTSTANTLSYPEVGSFTLSATPAANYLGSADLSGRVLIYATTSTAQSNVVGRFTPDHFVTAVTHGCAAGSFTYAGQSTATGTSLTTGQPFTVTVTALNRAGAITLNYAGSYAKTITLSLLTPPSSGATLSPANSTFTNGVAPISATLAVLPWTASFSSAIRAVDSDGISSSGYNEDSTNFRIGRVRLMNASGSDRLDLPMPMHVEYWVDSTNGWKRNSNDSCTGDSASPVTLEKDNMTLSPAAFAAVCAYDSGTPGASGIGCAAAGPPAKQFLDGAVTGFAGNFNLNFRALTSANTGTANNTGTMMVKATVPSWLRYKWISSTYDNPSARATFGQVGNSKVIYRREMY